MKRRLLIAILAALAIAAAAIALRHPWDRCDAPEPVCTVLGQIEDIDYVLDAEVAYDASSDDPDVSPPVLLTWEFHLRDTLSPQQAAATAVEISERTEAVAIGSIDPKHTIGIVSGQPRKSQVRGLENYPLRLRLGDHPHAETLQAFSLWQHGATRVDNALATAETTQALLHFAQLAEQQGFTPVLELADGSIRYTPNGEFKVEELRIAVEAKAQSNVDTAIFGSGSLTVYSGSPDDSAQAAQIKQWLDSHAPLSEPTAYSLSSPGFSTITEGWIGRVLPEHLIAKPPVLPEDVTAWTKDDKAPACAKDDIQLSLSSPDAAAGSRYLALYARNVAGHPCSLHGYPQISFLNADGEVQDDARTLPETHISAERIVIPAGRYAISTLSWNAMSTSQDPDETVDLRVAVLPGLEPVILTPNIEEYTASLDIIDGARVDLGPWVQDAEGWAKPDSAS